MTTPDSKSGIYLIRFAVPREHQWGFPWSLTIIRANTPVGSLVPYIAFDSDAAAAEFIARKGDDRLSVIEASQLDLSVHFIHASGALVFRSLAELDGWVSNPAAGGGQWKSLPPAGLLSDFVRALKNWRAKRASRHLV